MNERSNISPTGWPGGGALVRDADQQSADLGSSITDALRVYSDDMRHKRLSRAEEKAYALPAKLSLPMMSASSR